MRYRDNSKLLLLWKLIVTLTTAPRLGVVPQNAWPVAEIAAVSADAMPTEAKVTMKKATNITAKPSKDSELRTKQNTSTYGL